VRETIERGDSGRREPERLAEIEVMSQTILIQLTVTDEIIAGIFEDITAR
jgi:hypothetical protein